MSGTGPVATGSVHANLHESKYEEKRQENVDHVSGKMKASSISQQGSSGNPRQAAEQWVKSFSEALASKNTAAIKQLFAGECHWRDLLSFTWNLKTLEGHDEIVSMLEETLGHVQPSNWQVVDEVTVEDGISTVWLKFETAVGRCNGVLRLNADGQAWTLLTTMYELKGYEEQQGRRRPLGTVHQVERKYRPNWLERRTEEQKELGYSKQPYVLIIGGGQGGLGLAARLKQLQVPTLIVDKHARSGDQWRSRYSSLCLHDPVWYDDLPYLKFPSHWPIFSPKDKMGDWLESYAKIMELDVWNSTMCKKASYDEHKKEWTVHVSRNGEDVTLHPTQLVFATGMSGMPSKPVFAGQEKFQGQILHSSEFKNAQQYNGKHAVVIGSNNSSFDICGELYMSGADVTMIQRTTTHLVKSDSLMEHALGGLYSEKALEAGLSAEKADALNASIPYMIMHKFHIPVYDFIKKEDADFYRRMEEAGFMLDFGADGSGLFMKYLRRGSGYYIDVGACERVADGSIKLKTKVSVKELKEKSVVFDDGTELPADVIVCATGYRSMNTWLIDLVSPEMAYKVGKVWGLGSGTTKDPGPAEREPRNMWKPTQQEQLWFHGGNLAQSRYYSQFLALQLKARYEGLDTPVYQLAPVHHKE